MQKWLISLFITALVLSGCSSTQEQTKDEKVATTTEQSINASNNGEKESREQKNVSSDESKQDTLTTKAKDNKNGNQTSNTKEDTSSNTNDKKVSEYPTFSATVVRVIDGDTIEISIDGTDKKSSNNSSGRVETVRFLLIDTPETVSTTQKNPKVWS